MDLRPAKVDSPLERRVRVFLGLGPAAPEWAEPLSFWIAQVSRRYPNGIRWIPPENFHVTLRFLGSVSQEEVLSINEVVENVAANHSPFVLTTESWECF